MNKFIFIHIPKTAGTSLHSALIDAGLITSPTFDAKYLNPSTAVSLNDYQCIYGHLSYMDGLKYFNSREYLTVLREPVERVISWYWYAKNNVMGNSSDDVLMAKQLPMAELFSLEGDLLCRNLSNRMVRQLGGDIFDYDTPLEVLYEKAKENLQKFRWVGFTDTLNDNIQSLSTHLGVGELSLAKLNESTKDANVSEEVKHKVVGLNYWDIKLYNFAKENFTE